MARDASEAIGDASETGWFVDETSFLKKGKSSVGVQRQWSGRAGKVENCQVGVFASLGRGDECTLIDFQLYLPESWAEDPEKCDKAGISEGHRIYQSKWRQALDMVKRARANQVKFGWVEADALYGNNHGFLSSLEDSGERFMADIHSNHKVWLEPPALKDPSSGEGKRGRPATRLKPKANTDRSLYQQMDRICRDIVELLDDYLPRRNREEQNLHVQIEKRHAARQRDIDRRRLHKPGLKPCSNLTK